MAVVCETGRDGTSERPEAPPGARVWIRPPAQARAARAGTREVRGVRGARRRRGGGGARVCVGARVCGGGTRV